jgi:hypothetical protein
MAREGVPLIVIQRQLGHTNLGITSSTTPRSSTPSTPAARRWSHAQLARTVTPRPAAGKPTTSSPPVLVQIASQQPGVASSPQTAPIIATQRSRAA